MKTRLKKQLAVIMSLLCTVVSVETFSSNTEQYIGNAITYYGDVNIDYDIDVSDVILLQKYLVNQADEEISTYAADMDDSGTINAFDLLYLERLLIYGVYPGENPYEGTTEETTQYPTEEPTYTTTITRPVVTTTTVTTDINDKAKEYALEVVDLVNEQRAVVGVAPVEFNEDLFEIAMIRANELPELFSHTRPNGEKWSVLLKEYNIAWTAAAENIAAGRSTPKAVVNQWIESEGHYANMIGADYSQIGVGFVYIPDSKYRYYWVQIFKD